MTPSPHHAVLPRALQQFNQLPDAAHVDVRTVAGLFGISAPTVWRHARSGKLPAPRKIGASTRWSVAELRAFLAVQAHQEHCAHCAGLYVMGHGAKEDRPAKARPAAAV
jgi:predicted DNA-binding transcriptional regulator AlpA